MKQVIIFLLTIFVMMTSCEDVIDVDIDNIDPKLVVEADIEWEKGESGQGQFIHLSLSTDFFDENQVPVTTAEVFVNNLSSGEIVPFLHYNEGYYSTNDFRPEIGAQYQLLINYNGDEYSAIETLISVPDVNRVEQNTVVGFDGGDALSIEFYANDPAGEENFYYLTHGVNGDPTPYISIWDDNFQDGNELVYIYRSAFDDTNDGQDDDDLVAGDVIDIEYMGISESYANYMFILTEQAYGGFGPFSTTPVELRGNVINQSTGENALGFFRLSEKVTFQYIVE